MSAEGRCLVPHGIALLIGREIPALTALVITLRLESMVAAAQENERCDNDNDYSQVAV